MTECAYLRSMKKHVIREMRTEEISLLNDFLYEAIFIPEGVPAPPRSIIENEDLQVYVRDFGKKANLSVSSSNKTKKEPQPKSSFIMGLSGSSPDVVLSQGLFPVPGCYFSSSIGKGFGGYEAE